VFDNYTVYYGVRRVVNWVFVMMGIVLFVRYRRRPLLIFTLVLINDIPSLAGAFNEPPIREGLSMTIFFQIISVILQSWGISLLIGYALASWRLSLLLIFLGTTIVLGRAVLDTVDEVNTIYNLPINIVYIFFFSIHLIFVSVRRGGSIDEFSWSMTLILVIGIVCQIMLPEWSVFSILSPWSHDIASIYLLSHIWRNGRDSNLPMYKPVGMDRDHQDE